MTPIGRKNVALDYWDVIFETVPVALLLFVLTFALLHLKWRVTRLSPRANRLLVAAVGAVLFYLVWCVFDPPVESIALSTQCSLHHTRNDPTSTPVKIITYFDASQEFGLLASRINKRYAENHGMTWHRHRGQCVPRKRAVQWTKIALLYAELSAASGALEWVIWVDSDVVFTNDKFDLLSYLRKLPNSIVIAVGRDSVRFNGLNTGFMAVRNSQLSKKLLQEIWRIGAKNRLRYLPQHEQSSLNLLHAKYEQNIFILDGHPGVKMFTEDPSKEQEPNLWWRVGDIAGHAAGWPHKIDAIKLLEKRSKEASLKGF